MAVSVVAEVVAAPVPAVAPAVAVVAAVGAVEAVEVVEVAAVAAPPPEQGEYRRLYGVYQPKLTLPRSSSNIGGATRSGSGVRPAFGRGGAFYAGGARSPYAAGRVSPLGVTPFLLPAAALAFFPALWLYSVYAYPYHHPYNFYNQTSNRNESLPVVCVCQEFSECGCDDNHNSTYFNDLFGGPVPKNTSNVRVVDVNGTETIYVNGTLPNGTTRADSSTSDSTATIAQLSGYWVTAAVVVGAVWLL